MFMYSYIVCDFYKFVRVCLVYVVVVFCIFVKFFGVWGFYKVFLDWKSVCEVLGICMDFIYKVLIVFCLF